MRIRDGRKRIRKKETETMRAFKVAKMRDGTWKGVVSSCISARRWRHSSSRNDDQEENGGDSIESK